MWVLCCWACMLMSACMQVRTSLHKQENGIGSIQSSMIHCQRDYSLQWHFCTRVDSPSFRFRWIHEKAALPGAEGAALSFSVFYGREFGSQLQSQIPLVVLLGCKDSAMRQSGLWHHHKPVLDVQIFFQNISCWGLIKLTPISQAACVQASWADVATLVAECSAIRPGPNNILWQKQAKEDVETRRDLTGSRPAIHSFSARLRVNTSLQIKCLSKNTTRAESSFTTGKEQSNCELFKANEGFHLIPSTTSLYCPLSDDTQRGTFSKGFNIGTDLNQPSSPSYYFVPVHSVWTPELPACKAQIAKSDPKKNLLFEILS